MYNMPRNFERQRYAESLSDQRSIYYRRERSPMSIYSAYDIQPRNFQQRYNGISSQQSVFSGRGVSPSIDSTASVSAAEIVFAFKNVKYNKYDLKVIKEAYQKLMKHHRKTIEKRRNTRMFLKGFRNQSRDDSGDQASDSSISSDDCRSVKTSCKENMSSSRMTRMDNMLKDSTESFTQNTFKNIFSVRTNSNISKNFNSVSLSNNYTMPSQKERFKTGFVLPSQRFNKSVASTIIPRNIYRNRKSCESNYKQNNRCMENRGSLSGSEEEIFPGTAGANTACEKKVVQKRRLVSEEDSIFPDRKRSKKSPQNVSPKSCEYGGPKNSVINCANINSFEFAKPRLPVRKFKSKMQEKVISKSKQPITEFVESNSKEIFNKVKKPQPILSPEEPGTSQPQIVQSESSRDCDVFMRPSFIKRKLFTQKLDVTEKTNISSDAISSPQSLYSAFQKEKNKTRKLVPTQSCMNREVQGDDNLLALIHKIVPPDSINNSSQIKMDASNSNKQEDEDTWDVTSVISMCNENDASDTFTDEEIINGDDRKKDKNKITKNTNHRPKTRNRNIINTKKNVNSDVSLHHESRKVNNKTDKETGKKTKSANSRPITRSNSKTKDKPKPTYSIDKNINSPQLFNINTNKTDKERSKKVNNINPYRITRNNSFIKLKETKSINQSFSSSQNEEKSNNSNSRPQTRSNSILKVSKSVDENMNMPCDRRIATSKRDKEKTKLTNNLTPHRITRNNSNVKIKETKSMDVKKNLPEDKRKGKKNNSINYHPKSRNSNLKTKAIKNVEENLNVFQECRVLIGKMPMGRVALKPEIIQKTNSIHNTSITKNTVQRSAKTFWDTDFESDAEYQGTTPQRKFVK